MTTFDNILKGREEMSVKFFGQFLLERGKIIKEELLDALEFQKTINVKLGTIALDAGYLNAEQVERIRSQQITTDKLFGEIAIDMQYLTPEQLEELLVIQKNERISLGDALLQKGYLNLSELEEELKVYKSQQNVYEAKGQYAIVKSLNPEIPQTFIDLTIKFLRRLVDIDVDVLESHNNPEKIAPYLWNVCQQFYGNTKGMYILSLSEKPLLKIASNIAQENLKEIDDLAKDGSKEFVNTLVGNTVAKLSQKNIKLSLKPPELYPSLGQIHIDPHWTQTTSVRLSSSEYEIQLSIVYSPLS